MHLRRDFTTNVMVVQCTSMLEVPGQARDQSINAPVFGGLIEEQKILMFLVVNCFGVAIAHDGPVLHCHSLVISAWEIGPNLHATSL